MYSTTDARFWLNRVGAARAALPFRSLRCEWHRCWLLHTEPRRPSPGERSALRQCRGSEFTKKAGAFGRSGTFCASAIWPRSAPTTACPSPAAKTAPSCRCGSCGWASPSSASNSATPIRMGVTSACTSPRCARLPARPRQRRAAAGPLRHLREGIQRRAAPRGPRDAVLLRMLQLLPKGLLRPAGTGLLVPHQGGSGDLLRARRHASQE